MAVERWHPTRCKGCEKVAASRLEVSATGLCPDCFTRRMDENNMQLAAHRGPYFEHWRRRMAASVGAAFLDDVRTEP